MHQLPASSAAVPFPILHDGAAVPSRGAEMFTLGAAWAVAFAVTAGFCFLTAAALIVGALALLPGVGKFGPVALLGAVNAMLAARLFFKGARCTGRYVTGLSDQVRATRAAVRRERALCRPQRR